MSDEDDILDFADVLASSLEKHMDGLHFVELFDLQSYFIGQPYLVQDLAFKVNNRKSKLNKKLKKGIIYGIDD